MILFNLIGFFYLGFPQINFHHPITIQLSREFPTITLMLYFPVVGFMYLVSSSVSLSIIVFYVVAVVQEGITNRIGYDVTRPDAFVWGMQSLSWQAWGGFVAMVAISLWMARRHLADVCRNVFWGQDTVDDREEMISYRTAVYGLFAVAGLCCWLAVEIWHGLNDRSSVYSGSFDRLLWDHQTRRAGGHLLSNDAGWCAGLYNGDYGYGYRGTQPGGVGPVVCLVW